MNQMQTQNKYLLMADMVKNICICVNKFYRSLQKWKTF